MGLASVYVSAVAPLGGVRADVPTDPPDEPPTCGECRWCAEVRGAWEGGLCLVQYEGSGMYYDLRTVDYDQCACEYFEEE